MATPSSQSLTFWRSRSCPTGTPPRPACCDCCCCCCCPIGCPISGHLHVDHSPHPPSLLCPCSLHPVDWNDPTHSLSRREPRRGQRAVLRATVDTPQVVMVALIDRPRWDDAPRRWLASQTAAPLPCSAAVVHHVTRRAAACIACIAGRLGRVQRAPGGLLRPARPHLAAVRHVCRRSPTGRPGAAAAGDPWRLEHHGPRHRPLQPQPLQ